MQTIVTKYIGPTNERAARIQARNAAGTKKYYPIPVELDGQAVHMNAAQKFAQMLGWPGEWIHGDLSGAECVFVCNHVNAARFTVSA